MSYERDSDKALGKELKVYETPEQKQEASDELSDANHDAAYCKGFKAGWNAALSDDEKAARSVARSGEEARKFIRLNT